MSTASTIAAPAEGATPPSPIADKAAAVQAPPKEVQKPQPVEKVRVRGYERARNVKAKLEAESESTSEPTDERETAPPPAPHAAAEPERRSSSVDSEADEAKAAPEKSQAEADAEKRRAERAERIARARERERAEDRERAVRNAGKQRDSEIEKLRKRIAELEPHEQVFSSEEALLAAAEAKGMSAEKLVQWMRTRLSDPAAVAQHQAKTEADKIREELRQLREEAQREREERARAEAQAVAERAGIQRAYSFLDKAKTSEASHPLTAGLQKRYGDKGLITFANHFVAPHLRQDYSLEELHDHVEQLLDELQVTGNGPGTTATQGTTPSAKNGAAKPPTTLSNSIASERGSVAEERPLHQMPRRDRVARLKAKLGSE